MQSTTSISRTLSYTEVRFEDSARSLTEVHEREAANIVICHRALVSRRKARASSQRKSHNCCKTIDFRALLF